jgi:hypothetical protein
LSYPLDIEYQDRTPKLWQRKKEIIMPKATFTLTNGTIVIIEGESEEIQALLDHYSSSSSPISLAQKKDTSKGKPSRPQSSKEQIDISMIVNKVKDCDEADAIERQILDKASQVNRTLLPIYIVYEYMDNSVGLTSGDINKITSELGIPIATPNVSHTLSGTASRYVMGDQVRIKGQPVRYKLSRRGVQYIKSVIAGVEDDNKE